MNQTIAINKTLLVVKFLILLLIIFCAPFIGNQFITGTIVNASLIISFFTLGFGSSILLCFLPSVISFALGMMALPLMIPFIILGNIILILSFKFFNKYWLSLFSGSILKFLFLFLITNTLIKFIVSDPVFNKIAIMMSYPQLVTAILGGILAYIVLKKVKLDF